MNNKKKMTDHAYYMKNREQIKKRTWAYALTERGKDVQRRAQAKYRKTEGSRAAKRRYKQTEKGKAAEKRSDRSPAGLARHKRYLSTKQGSLLLNQRVKRSFFKRMYGLTVEEYTRLSHLQRNRCKICDRRVHQLCVDHKEKGSFRGLLCNTCNVGLGMFADSIVYLQSAVRYLKAVQRKQLKDVKVKPWVSIAV